MVANRVWVVANRTLAGHSSAVNSVAVSADGQLIVSGSWDRTVKLWAAGSGECLRTLAGHNSDVHSVAVSADTQLIVSGSVDMTVKLWGPTS